MKVLTVGDLKEQIKDLDDDTRVMAMRHPNRFQDAYFAEMELDTSEHNDKGYAESDMFTRSLHRKKVVVIL